MSEINNIKPAGQNGINAVRIPVKGNRSTEQTKNAQTATVASDKVSLTDTATQLQSLQQAVAGASVVDQLRVEVLRAAIADDSYQVDSNQLAQNMINFEDQLNIGQ